MLRPALPLPRVSRPTAPNRPTFEFRIDEAGVLPQSGGFYVQGQVISGAVMRGSSGIVRVHGEPHGLVVRSPVFGLHELARRGVVVLRVEPPSFDLTSIVPGTVFASHASLTMPQAA